MNTRYEYIPVYIRFKDAKSICVCYCGNKLCERNCLRCTVRRDRYEGWREVMQQDKYGRMKQKIFNDDGGD